MSGPAEPSEPSAQTAPHAVISPMTTAHIAQIMQHEAELFGSEFWSPEAYRTELADKRYRHYVVAHEPGGELLGWAGLLVVGQTAQVLTVGVVVAAQRRGLGQLLLDTLTAEARRRGATELLLEVRVDNDPARRLYERNAFVTLRVRRGYYDLGRSDALEMRREL